MPVSLAQAKLNTQDDLDANVIDEFRKSSALLDALTFHDAVSPMGGGSTLTYGYHRVIAQRAAAFRAINNEYVPEVAEKARYTVDLKPLGGSFEIDRVLAQIARGAEVSFQMSQLIKATTTKFCDEVINGDTAVDANGFDGLSKALAGTTTELNADGTLANTNWSDLDTVSSTGQKAYDTLDLLFGVLDGPASVVIANDLAAAKIRAIARRANVYIERPIDGLLDPMGNPVTQQRVGNTTLIDPGTKAGSTQRIIPMYDIDNSVWVIAIPAGTDGGAFTLEVNVGDGGWEETASVAWNVSTGNLDTAISNLTSVPAAGVTVSGSAGTSYTLTFDGDLARKDVKVRIGEQGLTDGGVPMVGTATESANSGNFTDIYVARLGMDGFHGVSVAGAPLVQTWLPDFTTAKAVKTGEVEMGPVAAVLKATKAAGVLRRVQL